MTMLSQHNYKKEKALLTVEVKRNFLFFVQNAFRGFFMKIARASRQLGNTFKYFAWTTINGYIGVSYNNTHFTLCCKAHLHWERLWRKHFGPKWSENVPVSHYGKMYRASRLYEGLWELSIWNDLCEQKVFSLKLFFTAHTWVHLITFEIVES